MVLFFAKGEADSDKFVKFCYGHYRDIMSRYGADLPKDVQIVREEGQKPRFDTDEAYFNLSHSHGAIMLGISHSPIGVDIEKIRETTKNSISSMRITSRIFLKSGRKERVISNLPARDCRRSDAKSLPKRTSSIFRCGKSIMLACAPKSKI